MLILFYNSENILPSEELYIDDLSSERDVLLISNHPQVITRFRVDEHVKTCIIGEWISDPTLDKKVFVPVAVKETFLEWLKTDYPEIHWQTATEFADFKQEVKGELQAFFQQLRVVEQKHSTMQHESTAPQKTTMENNEDKLVESVKQAVLQQLRSESVTSSSPDKKDDEDRDEGRLDEAIADASKYVSVGFATVVLLSLVVILLFFLKPIAEIRQAQEPKQTSSKNSSHDAAPVPPPMSFLSIDILVENYMGQIKVATLKKNQWYVTNDNGTEDGTVFGIAKKIWALHTNAVNEKEQKYIVQATENALNEIVVTYSAELTTHPAKCPNLQKVYDFLCKESKLGASKKKIDEQFSTCKPALTCPPPPTKPSGS